MAAKYYWTGLGITCVILWSSKKMFRLVEPKIACYIFEASKGMLSFKKVIRLNVII